LRDPGTKAMLHLGNREGPMGIALVTGTSSGIGLATSITLARAGHTVFAGMRNLERSAELQDAVAKESLPVTVVQLDVDSDRSVEAAISKILADQGRIDVLVNNAGIAGGGPIEEAPLSIFRQMMETNFFGSLRCIKAVLPSMRERRSGCIVNISSVAGRFGLSPQGAYASTKWAVEGLSECLAQEVRPYGIRVGIVEPGIIATPMTMRPRPAPPPGPYDVHKRRMGAIFMASLATPVSPFVVGETVLGIVEGKSTQLRHPSGPNAEALIRNRTGRSDEEWVNLGVLSDAEFAADMKTRLGLAVKL
jgi:NAD(P)-dependent dehydrogenase (short-subunit alcohol dehydrogenase family)